MFETSRISNTCYSKIKLYLHDAGLLFLDLFFLFIIYFTGICQFGSYFFFTTLFTLFAQEFLCDLGGSHLSAPPPPHNNT